MHTYKHVNITIYKYVRTYICTYFVYLTKGIKISRLKSVLLSILRFIMKFFQSTFVYIYIHVLIHVKN
jgi:hypothetical protein